MSDDQREINLEEYCNRLFAHHAVNKELRALQHCREHPLRWAFWDFRKKWLPFVRWVSPLEVFGNG